MGDKSQIALEYLIIVGFVIVILVPITLLYLRYSGESSDTVTASKVEHITNEIVSAANTVYAYGEDSQTKIELDFPSNIQEIEFAGKEVIFKVINSKGQLIEIVQIADINLEGDITIMPGKKAIIVKSLGDSVSVTMPCVEGEQVCCTEEQKNQLHQIYGGSDVYDCYYQCINKVWTLKGLCDPCTQDGNQILCLEGVCPNGECWSIYEGCPLGKPEITGICSGLEICCEAEGGGTGGT